MLVNAIEQPLTDELLSQCDIVIVALYPQAYRRLRDKHMPIFSRRAAIVCRLQRRQTAWSATQLIPLAEEKGFLFVGGHPMAGLEHSGFTYAKKSLFNNASMIFTPTKGPIESMEKLKRPVYFNRFHQHRDRNAGGTRPTRSPSPLSWLTWYPTLTSKARLLMEHTGFSAGSYKDLTRVAKLNEDMWTELFLENPDNLADEIDTLIENLTGVQLGDPGE